MRILRPSLRTLTDAQVIDISREIGVIFNEYLPVIIIEEIEKDPEDNTTVNELVKHTIKYCEETKCDAILLLDPVFTLFNCVLLAVARRRGIIVIFSKLYRDTSYTYQGGNEKIKDSYKHEKFIFMYPEEKSD